MSTDDGPAPKFPVRCPVCGRPVAPGEGIRPDASKRRDKLMRFGCRQLALCQDLEAFQATQRWFLRNNLVDRA